MVDREEIPVPRALVCIVRESSVLRNIWEREPIISLNTRRC